MAEKTSDKSRKSPRKKTTVKKAANVTPINHSGLAHGANGSGATEFETRSSDTVIVEQIRFRAYELFEERGRLDGFDQEDWARAEAEILAKFQREKSA